MVPIFIVREITREEYYRRLKIEMFERGEKLEGVVPCYCGYFFVVTSD